MESRNMTHVSKGKLESNKYPAFSPAPKDSTSLTLYHKNNKGS